LGLFARLVIGMVALVAATSAATGWLAVHNIKAAAITEFVSAPSLSSGAGEAVLKASIFGIAAGILVAVLMTIAMRFSTQPAMAQVEKLEMDLPSAPLAREQSGANRLEHLSSRELEVFRYLIAGLANKEIARELQISPRTVEIHRGNLMRKLGTRNIVQLTQIATVYGVEPLHPK